MSEEIYREYVNKYFFECKTAEERGMLNKKYLWGEKTYKTIFDKNLEFTAKGGHAFFILNNSEFEFISRKPETHIIRGIEVVSPRFDSPSNCQFCYWINCISEAGIAEYDTESLSKPEKIIIANNGWFDNIDHAEAYVKALREGK